MIFLRIDLQIKATSSLIMYVVVPIVQPELHPGLRFSSNLVLAYTAIVVILDQEGRLLILILLLVVGFLPSSILTIQNIMKVLQAVRLYDSNVYITTKLGEIGKLVHEIQVERGRSTLFLSTNDGYDADAWQEVIEQREKVDKATAELTVWPEAVESKLGTLSEYQARVDVFRELVAASNVTYIQNLDFYSNINSILIDWMGEEITSYATDGEGVEFTTYQTMTQAKEYLGIERARGSVYWNKGHLSRTEFSAYLECQLKGKFFLKEAVMLSPLIKREMGSNEVQQVRERIDYQRTLIQLNNAEPSVANASQWFEYMTLYIEMMNEAQMVLSDVISRRTAKMGETAETTTTLTFVLFSAEFAIYPVFVYLTVSLVRRMKVIGSSLSSKSKHLLKEQRRNNRMLSQMYPPCIIEKLLRGQTIKPEIFEEATVCFVVLSDFDDIVKFCSSCQAIMVLNKVLDIMEEEILKFDVLKVETREDMVLLASGVPIPHPSNCIEISDLCLSLRARMRTVDLDIHPSGSIRIRCGICTGPVAAGIVGIKMPRYLLFGDTVNTAARMQSTIDAVGIQLTPSSGEILRQTGIYKLEQRRHVQVKGKGEMYTYWLIDKTIPSFRHVPSAELF